MYIHHYLFAIVIDYCMRKAVNGDDKKLGFTFKQRKSRRIGPKNITDVDFADDIALLSEDIRSTTALLHRVECVAAKIYRKLSKLSYKIRGMRLKLAGHCIRHPELLANDLVSWEPEARRGETKRDRPRQRYLSTLLRDVGINKKEELRTLMWDRDIWRKKSAVDRT